MNKKDIGQAIDELRNASSFLAYAAFNMMNNDDLQPNERDLAGYMLFTHWLDDKFAGLQEMAREAGRNAE